MTTSSSSSKRSAADAGFTESDRDVLTFTPLGGGCEVGRSCHLLQFKGLTILLDCGLHPAYTGLSSLPFFDEIDPAEIDVVLITHFHLDHIAALPYLLEKTDFKGQVFMTHPTKSIYKLILQDYIKVSTISVEETLYDEEDLLRSMDKIQCVNYHQQVTLPGGLRFVAFNAGHVLGAAMFLLEIAGVRILYTGDYSRTEDRHLMAAEVPPASQAPHVLIIEATYGTQELPPVQQREQRLCSLVESVVLTRQGSVLIPVFALGRAQELLLILDEYWQAHAELQHIPIYFASFLAKKCMDVYRTFLLMMNAHIQQQSQIRNPFAFKHIYNLKNLSTFDEQQPCVILASPGMLQNGVSRELLELWCSEERNACIIAGYAVEGTLAKHLLSEPSTIQASNGTKLPLKMSVHYISFSAHADFTETSEFIALLRPQHCILVHGDANEGVGKLKSALQSKYRDTMNIVGPKNLQAVELEFKAVKLVKTVGSLAQIDYAELSNSSEDGAALIEGVIVRKDLAYTLMSVDDLPQFTPIAINTITQSLMIPFHQTYDCLYSFLSQLYDCEDEIKPQPSSEHALTASEAEIGGNNEKESGVPAQDKKSDDAAPSSSTSSSFSSSSASSFAHEINSSQMDVILHQLEAKAHADDGKGILVTNSVRCYWHVGHIVMEWLSSPLDDMIADSLVSLLMNVQANPGGAKMIGVAHHPNAHAHAHSHSPSKDSSGASTPSPSSENQMSDQIEADQLLIGSQSSDVGSSSEEDDDFVELPSMLSSSKDSVILEMPTPSGARQKSTSSAHSSARAIIRLLEAQFGPSKPSHQGAGARSRLVHVFNVDGVIVHVEHKAPHAVRLVGAASVNDATFASLVVDRMRRAVTRILFAMTPITRAEEEEEDNEMVAQLNAPLDQEI